MALKRIAMLVLAGILATTASANQPGLHDGMADKILGDLGLKQAASKEHEASEVAAHFMAQFYGVRPSSISTTELEKEGHQATVSAATESGESCIFDVVRAPEGVAARHGWLIGSIHCN